MAKFDNAEWELYESSLKEYRDIKGYIDTAFNEGMIEGINKVAKKLKLKGTPVKDIEDLTGLTAAEIEKL